jgi:thiol:disulfide interchange protein DsbA
MKKISAVLFALLLSPLAVAAQFVEGKHYEVIAQAKVSKSPEIVEYFSFKCPACYRFEPLVEAMVANKPAEINFKKNHVDFIGGPTVGAELTHIYAIIDLLKVDSKLTPALFDAIHQQRKTFPSLSDYKELFVANGVDGDKFDKAAKSFMVKTHVSKMQRNTKKFAISGVPTFIINAKYKVITKALTSGKQFEELVFFLANKQD